MTTDYKKHSVNENCLIGYKCPKCGSGMPLIMSTKCMMMWYDDGTDDGGKYEQNMQIDPDGYTECVECGYKGKTAEFDAEKRYVDSGGTHCPYCNSENISGNGEGLSQDEHVAWGDVSCDDCGAEWQDQFKLIGIGNYPDRDFVDRHNEEVAKNDSSG